MKKTNLFFLLICLMCVVVATVLLIVTRAIPVEKQQTSAERRINARTANIVGKLGKAYAALEENNPFLAEKILLQLLKSEPANPVALRMLGRIYYESGRFESAIGIYRKLLARNEYDASACNNLGQSLARQGNFPEALIHLHKALSLNPGSHSVHFNLAGVYNQLKQPEKARDHFAAAERLIQQHQGKPALPQNIQTPGAP